MNAVYWDTSALLKLYVEESDSSSFRRALIAEPNAIAISWLNRIELYFALRAKAIRGEIASNSDSILFGSFVSDLEKGHYVELPVTREWEAEAQAILNICTASDPPVFLRSLDGIHLGAIRSAKIDSLVTADQRMREAAILAGIRSIPV